MIERLPITNRQEWLTWRAQDITASVIPALFEAFPEGYQTTPLKLHLQHSGIEFPDKDSKVTRRGRWLEPAVAEAVRELRPEWSIVPALTYFRDTELRLGATPDFFVHGDARGLGVLQAKTVAPSVWREQWENGRDPPFWVRLQIATEMLLSGAHWGAIAVLLVDPFNMECEIVEVARNPDVEAAIEAGVKQFWADVAAGNAPQPDFSKDAELIKHTAPPPAHEKVLMMHGNNELGELLAHRAFLLEQIKSHKSECEAIETQVRYLMQDAELISGIPGWRITWKIEPRRGYTVPSSTPRVLHIYDRRSGEEQS